MDELESSSAEDRFIEDRPPKLLALGRHQPFSVLEKVGIVPDIEIP